MLEIYLSVTLFLPAHSNYTRVEGCGEIDVVHPVTTSGVKAIIVKILLYFAQMYSALLTENTSNMPLNRC